MICMFVMCDDIDCIYLSGKGCTQRIIHLRDGKCADRKRARPVSERPQRHPLAGQTVRLKEGIGNFLQGNAGGSEFVVEDWADKVLGHSVWETHGNPAALEYDVRIGTNGNHVPIDDKAVYGKVGGFGHIIHDSEIDRNSAR